MKSSLITAIVAAISFNCAAQPPPLSSSATDPAIEAWSQARAKQLIEQSKAQKAREEAPQYLTITSLSDYPAPPAVKDNIITGIRARERGVLDSPENSIPSTSTIVANLSPAIKTESELRQLLSYTPVNISRTALKDAKLIGTNATGKITSDGATGLVRTFDVPHRGLVILSEDDYLASQTRLTIIRETLNETVNGTPARSYAARSKDGRGKAEVRWVTPQKSYWLTLITDDGSRIEEAESYLLDIARRIEG